MNHLLQSRAARICARYSNISATAGSLAPIFSPLITTSTSTSSSPLPQNNDKQHYAITLYRTMATGTRGARGHGWLKKYRAGLGGRHLQGRWHFRDEDELNGINDEVFAMNSTLKPEDNIPTEAYLDISVAGEESRRVVIELASAALPTTCENFRLLCQEKNSSTDEDNNKQANIISTGGYESTSVYKIEKTVGLCMGDIVSDDGTGGRCHPKIGTYMSPFCFQDEGHLISHTNPGIVSMMSPGVHRNDSRFIITTTGAAQLDGRFVAFGRVKEGMDVVNDIATNVFTKRGRPTVEIKVAGCGAL